MKKPKTGPYRLKYKYHISSQRRFGFIIFKDGSLSRPFFSKAKAEDIILEAIKLGTMPRLNGVHLFKILSRTFQAHKLPRNATVSDLYPYTPLTCET